MLNYKKRDQSGAVLIMVLILLMVMTVLGVSGVGNSVLEVKMDKNYLQNHSSEQSAGFGLKVAEQWLRLNVTPATLEVFFGATVAGKKGLYSMRGLSLDEAVCKGDPGCTFDPRQTSDWCNGGAACPLQKGFVTLGQDDLGTGNLPSTDMSPADLQPQFIIEYLGSTKKTGAVEDFSGLDGYTSSSLDQGVSTGELQVFRVTAIGWGYETNVRNVLQRNYYLSFDG